jgi:hypothetical protein
MATKGYYPKEITINFLGLPIDSGYADGEFCKIKRLERSYGSKVGTDGEVTRVRKNNRLTEITLSLMQTSSGNDKLSGVLTLDDASANGAGVGPLIIRDRAGNALYYFSEAWITGPPEEVTFDADPTSRQWVLEGVESSRIDGGA